MPRGRPGAVIHDPAVIVDRTVRMVLRGPDRNCRRLRTSPIDADTVLLHGDNPGAVQLARLIRAELTAAGVTIAPLAQVLAARRRRWPDMSVNTAAHRGHESGDSALRVVAVSADREANWTTVHAPRRVAGNLRAPTAFTAQYPPTTPCWSNLTPVHLSPPGRAFVLLGLRQLGHAGTQARAPREFDVPVVYGGEYGPDLERVADQQGLATDDVIALHTASSYVIRCLGAPAGSPMMDGPDFPLPVPRLKDPRLSVPAGAVAVAGRQAVIAPAVAPGGWCVIGQTPLTVLNLAKRTAGALPARRPADFIPRSAAS